MRQLVMAALLTGSLCFTDALPAQQTAPQPATTLRAVRLAFERVDQVAIDFGVDTASLRGQAIRRLATAGISVALDSTLPELLIAVRVPKSIAPVDLGVLQVDMWLRGTERSGARRTIWNAAGTTVRFAAYGSLRQLVPEQLARGLDALAAAHVGT
jgi:hypothetical protein